jgi:glycosyltransferase involved in cell wall biosynthesis
VDDSSLDSSIDIVKKYSEKDYRIKIIQKTINEGPLKARETGIKKATSQYIAFCDSDDYMSYDSLELMYNAAIDNNADLVIANYKTIYPSGKIRYNKSNLQFGLDNLGVAKSLLLGCCSHSLCDKLFNKKVFDFTKILSFKNYTNGEDALLLYQILPKVNTVTYLDRFIYYYVKRLDSSTDCPFTIEVAINWLNCLNIIINMLRTYYGTKLDKEINANVAKRLRLYYRSDGDPKFIREYYPDISGEIVYSKNIKSLGIMQGTHLYFYSKYQAYRFVIDFIIKVIRFSS